MLAAVRRTHEVAARVSSGAEGVVRLGTVNGSGERLYRASARLDAAVCGCGSTSRRPRAGWPPCGTGSSTRPWCGR